ncbi:MAG TPA: glycosyltransferase family 2 protein [Thermoleophilaceae bacterium]|jgi:rhamnosyltransferase
MPDPELVSVAIPVRDGGASFREMMDAVAAQRLDRPVEVVVADSGSTDGTREEAARRGARVIDVPPGEFSHGGTRNLLVERSRGAHVAFLTDDATPASETWLAELLAGFDDAEDVGLVYGPYVPRPDASPMVRRELTEFFRGMAGPGGGPRVDRGLRPGDVRPGLVTFYTDANGCLSRRAWERVPYRPVTYAEDQLLALDMLAAGFAKVFRPQAAVIHSHDYPPRERLGRFFDEFRALREVYGHVEEVGVRHTLGTIRTQVRRDRAFMRSEGRAGAALDRGTLESLRFHASRAAGAALGSRADRIPDPLRRALSREGRAGFAPVEPPDIGRASLD